MVRYCTLKDFAQDGDLFEGEAAIDIVGIIEARLMVSVAGIGHVGAGVCCRDDPWHQVSQFLGVIGFPGHPRSE